MAGSASTPPLEGPCRREADGTWHAVTWEQAFSGVASDVADALARVGPRGLAVYAGRAAKEAASRASAVGRSLGSERVFAWREADDAALAVATRRVLGHPVRLVADLDRAVHVLRLGTGTGAPGLLRSCPGSGTGALRTLTVAHPRPGPSPARVRLSVRPGSEVFLVLGLAHTILGRDWQDTQFLRDHTRGSEEAVGALEPWTPERCASRCGLSGDELVAEALRFARAPMAVATTDAAVFQSPAGGVLAWGLLLLHAATANLLRPGGLYAPPPSPGTRAPGALGRQVRAWAGRLLPPRTVIDAPVALLGPPDPPRVLLALGGLPDEDYGPSLSPLIDDVGLIVQIGPGLRDPRTRWFLPSATSPGGRPSEDVLEAILDRLAEIRTGPGIRPGMGWRLALHEAVERLQVNPVRWWEHLMPSRPTPVAHDDRARWDVTYDDGRLRLEPPASLAGLTDAWPDPARPIALYARGSPPASSSPPEVRLHPAAGLSDGARVVIDTSSSILEARVLLDSDMRPDAAEVCPFPPDAGSLDVVDPATGEPWRHGAPCHILPAPTRHRRRTRP